ncbi:GNAT family N-acetyltransferase [Salipiger mangrovisoli]|uniref:GNAT family N-acetyltransferase n=1 Tax=Salipiger mangrovisoli TaxID=2865933 RepID=A0ABR9WXN8_9RHOB|nr:GNAT family N-acetyltransferase [Salipiger mangrovisoli]MBE9636060.1 GNAT family N-acetyltransferase [Salipiger mangrovisoli]
MQDTTLVPVLETERLILRGHRADDFEAVSRMWADPRVVAHISGVPSTREQAWARLLRYTGHWLHLGFGYWAVTDRADGTFLGEVGFADYRRDTEPDLAGVPEAGWVFAVHAHGKGYATEAVTAMLRWADATLGHAATVAMFEPAHAASIHVARKVGFRDERKGRYGGKEALFLYRPRRSR